MLSSNMPRAWAAGPSFSTEVLIATTSRVCCCKQMSCEVLQPVGLLSGLSSKTRVIQVLEPSQLAIALQT